jgi:phospholipid/cholesterol/gamma-HCH transport system substrate-binding protein/paraquat-inducible protein B
MDAKPHYFKIGLFVLVAVTLIVVAIVLLSAGLFARNKLFIESYFSEPITGLSEGSQVQFRGVLVGRVEQIGFVGSVYELEPNTPAFLRYASYVRVVSGVFRSKLPEMDGQTVEVVLQRMVERGLRVRVSTNILTEQAYLEIDFLDPNRFPTKPVPWVPRYPVIPSASGQLTTIKDSLDRILSEIEAIDFRGLIGSLDRLFTSLNTTLS